MSVTDELLQNARGYAEGFDKGDLPMPPARKVAVVACMDARLDPQKVLGLAAILAVIDVLIFTALATLGSFLYNLAATVLGGLEVTLAED